MDLAAVEWLIFIPWHLWSSLSSIQEDQERTKEGEDEKEIEE